MIRYYRSRSTMVDVAESRWVVDDAGANAGADSKAISSLTSALSSPCSVVFAAVSSTGEDFDRSCGGDLRAITPIRRRNKSARTRAMILDQPTRKNWNKSTMN